MKRDKLQSNYKQTTTSEDENTVKNRKLIKCYKVNFSLTFFRKNLVSTLLGRHEKLD